MICRAVENPFQHSQVRNNPASVEILKTIEDNMITIGGNFENTVSRVNSAYKVRQANQAYDTYLQ